MINNTSVTVTKSGISIMKNHVPPIMPIMSSMPCISCIYIASVATILSSILSVVGGDPPYPRSTS